MRLFTAPSTPLALASVALLSTALLSKPASAQTPRGYAPAWSDEFNGTAINNTVWENLTRRDSFNNELQYYLPAQAAIANTTDPTGGEARRVLRITATNQPFDGKGYRSARLESRSSSNSTVLFGRVEVLAKIPTTKGIWPAIWLFPNRDVPWPTGGEIDILEHKGSIPDEVSSAYHYNATAGSSSFRFHEHAATESNGQPTMWANDFHEYALEWDPHEIRFYVDGYNHFTVVSDTAPSGYKPNEGNGSDTQRHVVPSTAMNVILNTAVGGWFDGNPDATTVFPQLFDIDYVRTFSRTSPITRLDNGTFAQRNSAWVFNAGSSVQTGPAGDLALNLNSIGVARQFVYGPAVGATYQASVDLLPSTAGAAGTLRVQFFSQSSTSLGVTSLPIAHDASKGTDAQTFFLNATAPAGTVYATVEVRGASSNLWADTVALRLAPALLGDFNGDGAVNAADFTLWRDSLGSTTELAADANGDGVVGPSDYNLWSQSFGDTAAALSIPEPTALATVLVSIALLALGRR
ncbi:MAG: family 16 glycosylhydrolase [Lacipirellulaceae bacterium]